MKKVSIVLPVYNGESYLAESIESVLDQTYSELELIIVDDRSTDKTPEIIKQYMARDPRIKTRRNKKNLKLPRALNVGFLDATGEYRTWTSHDNKYDPEAIEKMVALLEEHPEAALVCADYRTIDERGEVTGEVQMREPEDIFLTNTVGACFLYRHEVSKRIGGYDTEMFLAEDYDYWIRLSKLAPFYHLPETLYSYRVHPESLSSKKSRENNTAYIRVVRKHFKYLYDNLDTKERKEMLINELMNRAHTFSQKWQALRTIDKRRRDWKYRVLHGKIKNLFRRKETT